MQTTTFTLAQTNMLRAALKAGLSVLTKKQLRNIRKHLNRGTRVAYDFTMRFERGNCKYGICPATMAYSAKPVEKLVIEFNDPLDIANGIWDNNRVPTKVENLFVAMSNAGASITGDYYNFQEALEKLPRKYIKHMLKRACEKKGV